MTDPKVPSSEEIQDDNPIEEGHLEDLDWDEDEDLDDDDDWDEDEE